MNKHSLLLPVLGLLLGMGLSACHMDAYEPYEGEPVLIRSQVLRDYNIDDLFDIARSSFDLPAEALDKVREAIDYTRIKDRVVRFVMLEYWTQDPLGRPVQASGSLVYPLDFKNAKGVVDVLPFGYMDNSSGSYAKGLLTEQVLVFLNQIVITPNMLEQGLSARANIPLPLREGDTAPGNDILHPMLHVNNSGRVAYDMHIAAAQYFKNEFDYDLPQKTTIFGYSEGATDAIALNRWIDLHAKGNIVVDRLFSGGGAHDPLAAMEALRETKKQFYSIIPSILCSIDFWDTDMQVDYSKVFTGPLLEEGPSHFTNLYNRSHWFWDIKSILYNVPSSTPDWIGVLSRDPYLDLEVYIHPDFFYKDWEDPTNEFGKFIPYLKENCCAARADWTPKNPIHLYHAVGDKHIPEACTASAYQALRKKGANVTYTRCEKYADITDPHASGGVQFFIDCCAFLLLN